MRSTSRCLAPLLAGLALLACPRVAHAVGAPSIFDNAHTYPLGSRAAGMGGAYTALACDEAAIHYNPSALACAGSSRLELSANAYMIQGADLADAFGLGEDISATTYHSIPSIVGGARVLLDGDAVTHQGRLVFGISVSIPHSLALKVEPANPDKPNYLTYSVREDVTAADIGLGYQLTPTFALGLSVGAALRTFEGRQSILVVGTSPASCGPGLVYQCYENVAVSSEAEALAVGLRARLGARLTPTPELSFGVSITSPAITVFGSYKQADSTTAAFYAVDEFGDVGPVFGPILDRYEGSADVGLPFRIALGAAYSRPGLTLSFDVSANLPYEIAIARDLSNVPVRGFSSGTGPIPDVVLTRAFQPNANVGIEVSPTEGAVLDFGLFSDLSGVSQEDVDRGASDRVHMFGATAALGLLGEQTRGWFGLSFEAGAGDSRVPSGKLNLDTVAATGLPENSIGTLVRYNLVGFIGSNYSFLPEKPKPDPEAKAEAE